MLGLKVLGLLFTLMVPGSWSYSPCHQWEHQLARCNVELFRSPGSCGDDYWADLVRESLGSDFWLKSFFFRYLKRFFEVRRVVWRRQKGWSSWIIERGCDFVVKKVVSQTLDFDQSGNLGQFVKNNKPGFSLFACNHDSFNAGVTIHFCLLLKTHFIVFFQWPW